MKPTRNLVITSCLTLTIATALLWLTRQPDDKPGRPSAPLGALEHANNRECCAPSKSAQVEAAAQAGVALARQDITWQKPAAEPAFAAFQQWTTRFAVADGVAKGALTEEGQRLAKARRSEFARTMRENPARALELAVPMTVRRTLPPDVLAQLEWPVDARGDLEHLAALPDPRADMTPAPSSYEARINGVRLRAYVTAERADQISRYGVPIHGYKLDEEIVVRPTAGRLLEPVEVADARAAKGASICPTSKQDTQIHSDEAGLAIGDETQLYCSSAHAALDLEARTAGEQQTAAADGDGGGEVIAESSYTEGAKKILMIRIVFPDRLDEPAGSTAMLGTIDTSWTTWSYGKCTVDLTNSAVTPTVQMPEPVANYADNYSKVVNDAYAVARTAGYEPNNYNFRMIMMDGSTPGFGFAGLAVVGGPWSIIRAEGETGYGAGVATHELGHNLGLGHAQSYTVAGSDPIASGGTTSEYGDPYDTMGGSSVGNSYSARYKLYLNWLTAADYTTATGSGFYRIAAHDDSAATGVRGLKVARTTSQDYNIEYRTERGGTQGTFNDNGVQVRWAPSGTGNGKTQILDMTSGSGSGLTDCPLAIGKTFADVPNGVFLTAVAKVVGSSFDSMDVLVNVADSALPSPWMGEDVGAVGAAGLSSFVNGTFVMNGSGADIWSTVDEFQFVHRPCTGDCDIRARVPVQTNTNVWAKAGVMIRDGTAASAVHASMVVTPGNGFSFQYRAAAGGVSAYVAGPALNASPNNWVRLTRVGNVLTGYVSTNGAAWTQVGTATVAMAATAKGGLAMTSHADAVLGAATFDNVSVIDSAPVSVVVNDTFDVGAATPGNDANDSMDAAWVATSGTVSVVADTTIGSGNAIHLDATSTFSTLRGVFAPETLAGIGDSIKVTCDFRYTAAVTNTVGGFRFGLFNGAGDGYGIQHGTGGSTTYAIVEDTGADGGFGGGTTTAVLTSGSKATINDQLKHTASFTVTKTATGLSLTGIVDGVAISGADGTGVITTFDTFAIRNGNLSADLNADNVRVEYLRNLAPAFTVSPFPGAGVTEDAAYSDTLAGTAADPNIGDSLSYSKVSGPAWLSVAANGALSGTPANGDVGTNSFVVRVTDSWGLTDDTILDIAVANTNDAPTFTADPIAGIAATEGAAYSGTLAGSATDVDAGDSLTYSKVSGPAWLTVASNGVLAGTPDNADVGSNAFTVRVTDSSGSTDNATLNIAVANTNNAPVFAADPIIGAGATVGIAYSGTLAASASDVDAGDTLIFSKVSGPAWLGVAANGALSGTPSSGSVGVNSFTVRAIDAGGLFADAALNITVTNTLPSGWSASDIGAVGIPGSATQNDGTYTVSGSGADIWGTGDAFQFVSQTLLGDGEIRARVASQTGSAAKAGIMIRDGSSPGAVNAMATLAPSGFHFQYRSTPSAASSVNYGPAPNTAPNNWIRLTRSGNVFTAYYSANGTSWTQMGSTTLSMASSVSIGLAVCSKDNTALSTATFDNVAITPFPAPWLTSDLGTTGLAGSAEFFGSAYTVKGGGAIGGATDGFRYVYQPLSGDGSIVARVSTLQDTGTNARIGVMIRETLTSNSRMAALSVTGSGAWRWQRRTSTGGNVATTNSSSGTAPNLWVRLTRSGSTITASRSTDGVSWTTISSVSVSMVGNCYIGLSVASGSVSALNTSVFDNVTVAP